MRIATKSTPARGVPLGGGQTFSKVFLKVAGWCRKEKASRKLRERADAGRPCPCSIYCGGKLHFKAPTGRFEGSPLAACGRRGPGESPGGRRSSSERSTRTHTHLHALTYTCQRYCRRSNAWASMHARRARASHEPPDRRRGPQRPGG